MDVQKLAGNFSGVAGKLDTVVKAAKGVLCLPSMLKSFAAANPASLLKGLLGAAGGLAGAIAGSIVDAITDRVNTLLGIATLPLRMIQGYVKSLLNIVDNIKSILKNLKSKAGDLKNFFKNTQNCSVQTANFMNCIATAAQNKITKAVLSKISKPLSKLDNQFNKLQRDIQADVFKAGGMLEQHVGRQLAAAEKLTKQLSILTR